MKKLIYPLSILILFLTISCDKQPAYVVQTGPLSGEDLLANQDLDNRFCEAMSQKDIEQVMNCFWDSQDLIFVGLDGTVVRGSENIRKVVEEMFAQFESMQLVINDISHVRLGENVMAVGTATYDMSVNDSTHIQIKERWSDVRIKIDGRWVYVLDHVHPLVPPEANDPT